MFWRRKKNKGHQAAHLPHVTGASSPELLELPSNDASLKRPDAPAVETRVESEALALEAAPTEVTAAERVQAAELKPADAEPLQTISVPEAPAAREPADEPPLAEAPPAVEHDVPASQGEPASSSAEPEPEVVAVETPVNKTPADEAPTQEALKDRDEPAEAPSTEPDAAEQTAEPAEDKAEPIAPPEESKAELVTEAEALSEPPATSVGSNKTDEGPAADSPESGQADPSLTDLRPIDADSNGSNSTSPDSTSSAPTETEQPEARSPDADAPSLAEERVAAPEMEAKGEPDPERDIVESPVRSLADERPAVESGGFFKSFFDRALSEPPEKSADTPKPEETSADAAPTEDQTATDALAKDTGAADPETLDAAASVEPSEEGAPAPSETDATDATEAERADAEPLESAETSSTLDEAVAASDEVDQADQSEPEAQSTASDFADVLAASIGKVEAEPAPAKAAEKTGKLQNAGAAPAGSEADLAAVAAEMDRLFGGSDDASFSPELFSKTEASSQTKAEPAAEALGADAVDKTSSLSAGDAPEPANTADAQASAPSTDETETVASATTAEPVSGETPSKASEQEPALVVEGGNQGASATPDKDAAVLETEANADAATVIADDMTNKAAPEEAVETPSPAAETNESAVASDSEAEAQAVTADDAASEAANDSATQDVVADTSEQEPAASADAAEEIDKSVAPEDASAAETVPADMTADADEAASDETSSDDAVEASATIETLQAEATSAADNTEPVSPSGEAEEPAITAEDTKFEPTRDDNVESTTAPVSAVLAAETKDEKAPSEDSNETIEPSKTPDAASQNVEPVEAEPVSAAQSAPADEAEPVDAKDAAETDAGAAPEGEAEAESDEKTGQKVHEKTPETVSKNDKTDAPAPAPIKAARAPEPPKPRPPVVDGNFKTPDGLELHYKDFAPQPDPSKPELGVVLCLHGLTRNGRDFEELAPRIAAEGWRVIVADQRGRGQSDWDSNSDHYQPGYYVGDMLGLLDHLNISKVVVVGTSMGGIMAMMMAAAQPGRLAGVVLNDVGPDLAPEGMERIASYVAGGPPAADWLDAAGRARAMNGSAFPTRRNDHEFWEAFARRLFRETPDGRILLDYDPEIARPFQGGDGTAGDLWPLFGALKPVPTLVVRGELSDLLMGETVVKMRLRKPDMQDVEAPAIGHAPFMTEPEVWPVMRSFFQSLSKDKA